MHPTAEFKSSAFPKAANEDAEIINPNRWGKRLAEFVRDTLPRYGVETEVILAEDWGWLVSIKNASFPLGIGCGPLDDLDEEDEAGPEDNSPGAEAATATGETLTEFCLFVMAEPGLLQRLFRKVDTTPEVTRVTNALKQMMAECPEFLDVSWSE